MTTTAEASSSDSFPVTVEVKGVTGPAQFATLSDAMTALLSSLRALPLSSEQQDYFDDLLGPPAVQTIGHRLATYGEVRALAFVGLTSYVVKLYPADPAVPE